MSYLAKNIIYKDDKAYEIIDIIAIHHFQNKDNSINKQVLGIYVHEKGGNHVLQQHNNFLICSEIEEAQIIE